jgi:hypothetical protein
MAFSLEYAKIWSDYENSYKCESYEKDCLYELMEKYQRLEKPIENIASTVFVYKKGEVVESVPYNWFEEPEEN